MLLGLLAAAVALVTVYVLADNSITSRKAELASLKTQVAQEQAAANSPRRVLEVLPARADAHRDRPRRSPSARFDWHTALADLSKVVPANTTLQSIVGTVVPGASAGGAGGAGASLRADITAPAFELTGCTANQDDVARLMSQSASDQRRHARRVQRLAGLQERCRRGHRRRCESARQGAARTRPAST